MIAPHGGSLAETYLSPGELLECQRRLSGLKKVVLDPVELSDLELLANGSYSPLNGFMRQEDYHGVVMNSRLSSGLVWTIPVTLSIPVEVCSNYRAGEQLALTDESGDFKGILQLEEIYHRRREDEAMQIFGTLDRQHPGVNYLFSKGEILLGGRLKAVPPDSASEFRNYRLSPRSLQNEFTRRGWKTVAVISIPRSNRQIDGYIAEALELADGVLLHPLAGLSKPDSTSEVWLSCYRQMAADYPIERLVVSVFPAVMRFAGPKEAVLHALIHKNFGCTHFIIDRDYAGTGNYYGMEDYRATFGRYPAEILGIQIIKRDRVSSGR